MVYCSLEFIYYCGIRPDSTSHRTYTGLPSREIQVALGDVLSDTVPGIDPLGKTIEKSDQLKIRR